MTNSDIFFSIIIPVYNRPNEVNELLQSLTVQTYKQFEILVVEDGSERDCRAVCDNHREKLDIKYFSKPNSGQGFSRNFGFEHAIGDYFIVFDSDCLIPKNYLKEVILGITTQGLDAFGGPDREHIKFTNIQRAISYSMTSLLTTGGIRGRKNHAGTFHPRSFNMGISRAVYEKTKGYKITRMGEDIEFSIRIIKNGFKVGLISSAFVFHKRRTNLGQFFKQLHFFGRARINVSRFYPDEVKLVHLFPLIFLLSLVFWLILSPFYEEVFKLGLIGFGFYYLTILIDSSIKNKSLWIGILSVASATIQLTAYGLGLLEEGLKKLKRK